MQRRLPRKLAAILYADVAGYSRLMGEDEDATHLALSEYFDLKAPAPKKRQPGKTSTTTFRSDELAASRIGLSDAITRRPALVGNDGGSFRTSRDADGVGWPILC